MKILLVGEFSSFHKYLKDGLVKLGHEVVIVANGDGWKNIPCDLTWQSPYKGIIGKLHSFYKLLILSKQLVEYDVVQLIAPSFLPKKFKINRMFINFLSRNNKKLFLIGAGASDQNTYIANFFHYHFKYKQLYNEIAKEANYKLWSQSEAGIDYNKWLHKKINGYIPIMYEYAEPYRMVGYDKLCPTIPIPINLEKVNYQPNLVGKKVVFFHGLNREGVKGTPLIREALERLEKNFPEEVEVIIDGKMPLDKYLQVINKTNVLIDQTYSASSGVNGLIGMAMGKVVVGGGEPECLKEFGAESCPMIPVYPSVDDIYSKLENILKNKDQIPAMGKASREYIEKFHNYEKIAQKFLSVWNDY